MSESDEDDFWSFNFRPQEEIRAEKLKELAQKPISSLRNEQIFDLIKNNLALDTLIPAALRLIEKNAFVNFHEPGDTEFSILNKHLNYFSKHKEDRDKFEKLKLWNKSKGNCINPKTGKVRISYSNRQDAEDAAAYFNQKYAEQYPNSCDLCGEWHLTPKSTHTPSKPCGYCSDADGGTKELYLSEEGALARAKIIFDQRSIFLKVYRCPHQSGWHLTKNR